VKSDTRGDAQLHLFVHAPPSVPAAPCSYALYRVALVREASVPLSSPTIRSSEDAATIFRSHLADVDREYFIILLLDRKNKVIGVNTVSIGSLTASIVSPREVFKPAILTNAAAIICGHNHPSGEVFPSHEDRGITTRLVQGGKLLDIQVLDHIIIGNGTTTYYSFADSGILA
jgi:DNA repair protein RadC